MSIFSVIIRNLKYYRKAYLAILAGTVISTAVLTGALVVGDSVRYSLGQLTDIRLGKTRFAIESDMFFRQQLAGDLSKHTRSLIVPLLKLEGIAVNTDKNTRLNRVEVLGIEDSFFELWDSSVKQLNSDEVILSRNAAEKLNLKPADEFILKIRNQAKAPENAPFVSEKEPLITLRLKVASIADDKEIGRFNLKSNQSSPFNIYISHHTLSRKIGLPGYANLLLVAGSGDARLSVPKLDSLIHLTWQAEDAGLEIRHLPAGRSYEVRSGRIFIEHNTAKSIQASVPEAEPILTYLVNDISFNGNSTPYSFVTAAGLKGWKLSGREIIINDWLAADLNAKPGDSIQLKYFKMGALRKLTEDSARFCVKTILPLTNPLFDRTLMPDFPGMSDAGNCRDWETGAPVDLDKIRDKDEQYWNTYRGTPKAFIPIEEGEKLWNNAFGNATAIRFDADSSDLQAIKDKLMKNLVPAENGLQVKDVYSEGKAAAANSTDFGSLFLSLSFFIIVAALLLSALLFSLHAHTRMAETAVMATLGIRKQQILSILFLEAFAVVLPGSILGTVCGIYYNKLLLLGLNTLWQDAVRTSVLQMHLIPGTLITGFTAGLICTLAALLFILLKNMRKPLSVSVKGFELSSVHSTRNNKNISIAVAVLSIVIAGIVIVLSLSASHSNLSEYFLSAGGLVLIAGIASLYSTMQYNIQGTTNPVRGFYGIVLRNAGMKKTRTITAITLLAIGTFSVIITGANRKTFYGTEHSYESGTGGFHFWAETTVPLHYDLNSAEGKEKYGLADDKEVQNVRFIQMMSLDGNDASCLNLNMVTQPTILGVLPQLFDTRHSFSFITLDPSVNDQHPWLALDNPLAPGILPAYADQTVITWGLHKKTGDTLIYTDEKGAVLKLKLMGGLDNSVFQGNILVSADLLRQYFPSAGGTKKMLIDGEFTNPQNISSRMEYLFQDYGLMIQPASQRLAQFNSVENAYLSVFMMLGGLGILLGTIGLGIVLLRNLSERKQEIAIYQAIGFRYSFVMKLIVAENLFILLAGIGIGITAAFTGILPSFFSPAFQLPATFLILLILVILSSGCAWIYFPVKSFLMKSLLESLRKE